MRYSRRGTPRSGVWGGYPHVDRVARVVGVELLTACREAGGLAHPPRKFCSVESEQAPLAGGLLVCLVVGPSAGRMSTHQPYRPPQRGVRRALLIALHGERRGVGIAPSKSSLQAQK